MSLATVYNIHKRYEQQGMQAALAEKPRSGQPRKVTPVVEAAVTQIACSAAPEGRARWTVRLINEKLITLGYELEDESVRLILKKSKLEPSTMLILGSTLAQKAMVYRKDRQAVHSQYGRCAYCL